MKNYISPADEIDLTAPVGGVVSGNAYKIGAFVGFAKNSASAGDKFVLAVEGAFGCTTDTGTAWAEGDVLYWDDNAKNFTKTAAGNTRIAAAMQAKAAPDTTSIVYLSGQV